MNKNRYISNYSLISEYRTVLMGLAIIFIMFCHLDVAQKQNGIGVSTLASFLQTGTVGVDIFLLLSGVGLYYSFVRKKYTYVAFEKKRMARILPYYFAIGGATYVLYDIIIMHLGVGKFLSDLFFISWFREGSTRYWYILAIVVFYLLFPLLYRLVDSNYGLVLLLIGSLVWFIIMGLICQSNSLINQFKIALERLPVFVCGVYCGKLAYEKRVIKKSALIIACFSGLIALVVLKTIIPHPFYDYLYYPVRLLLAISIISIVIIFLEWEKQILPKAHKVVIHILSWFGLLTLELYLFHQSYMILFRFPCQLLKYLIAAFLLPVISAFILTIIKKEIKKVKTG